MIVNGTRIAISTLIDQEFKTRHASTFRLPRSFLCLPEQISRAGKRLVSLRRDIKMEIHVDIVSYVEGLDFSMLGPPAGGCVKVRLGLD